ncbi:MAG: YceI family protein [Acidobacteria bacterium]|nr:YceI family protein [Acidobacteriota bacterium]
MMKKSSIFAAVAVALAAATVFAAPTTYQIDTAHSNVGFAVPILGGLSKVRGKFTDFTVQIVHDEADVTKSSVKAVIKAASIDTGIERRDAHLRNPDFFEVEKFPEITFESKRVEKKGSGYVAHGTFTMHGVSKEIELPFTLNGVRKNPANGSTTLGVTSRLTLNRKDFGINFSRPDSPDFLGDVIEIELDLVTRAAGGQPQPSPSPAPARP